MACFLVFLLLAVFVSQPRSSLGDVYGDSAAGTGRGTRGPVIGLRGVGGSSSGGTTGTTVGTGGTTGSTGGSFGGTTGTTGGSFGGTSGTTGGSFVGTGGTSGTTGGSFVGTGGTSGTTGGSFVGTGGSFVGTGGTSGTTGGSFVGTGGTSGTTGGSFVGTGGTTGTGGALPFVNFIGDRVSPTFPQTSTVNVFVTETDLALHSVPITITQYDVQTTTVRVQQVVATPVDDLLSIRTTVVHRPAFVTVTETKSDFVLSTRVVVELFTITHTAAIINHVAFTTTATEIIRVTSPVVRTVINTQRSVVTDYRTVANTVFVHGYH